MKSPKEETHKNEMPTTPQEVQPPPNGGYGWVCTIAAAIVNMHSWGFSSAYAVFLAYYLRENVFPGATAFEYACVGGLSLGCLLLASPITTICTRIYGIRLTMFIGAVFEAVSLICASFASQIWHLFLTQGVLFGLGLGFLFIPTAAVIPQWFTTKRSLASGVATGGAALGGMVYSLAAAAMIRTIGLPWAFRILGILAFVVNILCIIVIRDRSAIIKSTQNAFDLSLFKRWEYCLLIGFSGLTMLGYFILIFTLANYANYIGLNPSQASIASAIFNLGQAVGRPLAGHFSDQTGRINMAMVLTFLAGIFAFALWIPARSFGILIAFATIEGLVAGTFWATIAPLMAEVVGLRDVTSGLSLMWLAIVIPSTFSEPIALSIVESSGEYIGTELFTGFMYIAAAFCLWLLRGWKIGQTRSSNEPMLTSMNETSSSDAVGASGNKEIQAREKKKLRSSLMSFLFRCCTMANV